MISQTAEKTAAPADVEALVLLVSATVAASAAALCEQFDVARHHRKDQP